MPFGIAAAFGAVLPLPIAPSLQPVELALALERLEPFGPNARVVRPDAIECDGQREEVRGRRITLSAGAVASPAILLRSGIGPA